VILADWILPDGKGIDILPRQEEMVTCPLVIMTGFGDERLAVEIMKSGAIDYIVKSGNVFEQLPTIARRALREWENIRKRHLAEDDARDSQKRLADIISFLPDAVIAIDGAGRVIAWNRAIEEMTGIPADRMLGKDNYEYSIPFYGERRPILIDLVLQDNPDLEGKYLYMKRDGEKIVSEVYIPTIFGGRGAFLWGTASPLFDNAGNRIGAIEVIRDITERRHNEELLIRRESTLKTLMNAPKDTIALLDRQGIIVDINSVGAGRFGRTVGDILGHCAYDLIPPDVARARKEYIDQVFATGNPARFDDERNGIFFHNEIYPIRNKDDDIVERVAIFARDITGERKTAMALAVSEERFRHISTITTDFAYSCIRSPDGFFIDWISGAVRTITGFSDEELRAMGCWRSIVTDEDRVIFDENIASLIPGRSSRCELRIRAKNGTIKWLACFAECVNDPVHPGLHRLYGGCQDITERRTTELALQESENRYRLLTDNISDVLWVLNATTWKWEYVSPSVERLRGFTAEEMRDQAVMDVMTPASYAYLQKVMEERRHKYLNNVDRDRSYIDEIEQTCRNGSTIWTEVSTKFLITGQGDLTILGVSRDISSRKRAEFALIESEQKFRTVADYTYDWEYWILPDGTYKYVSPSCERISGYSPEEFYQNPALLESIVHQEDREKIKNHNASVIAEGITNNPFEFRIKTKSGNTIWIGHICHPIYNKTGEFIGRRGSNRDITQRKRAEKALLESETRFRALVQNSSDIIRILDTDGRIVYESASAERILGYPPGFMIGKSPLDLIHPEDAERVKADLDEVFNRTNPGLPSEFRIRKANGEYLWVDSVGTNLLDIPGVNGIVITTRPIEQRKRLELKIAESEERLRMAMEGADVASWDWDLLTGKAVFSDKFYTMLEYEPGDFPPDYEHWVQLIHPDDKKKVIPDLEEQIRTLQPVCEIEYRAKTKNGDWYWVLGRGKIAQTDDQGNPIRMTGVNIDITNRKLMESEVRSLNIVLEQRVKDRTDDLQRTNEALQEEIVQRQAVEQKLTDSLEEKTVLLKEVHHRVKNNLQIIASLLNLQSRYIHDDQTLAAIRESQNRVRAMALVHEKLYRSEDIAKIDLYDYIKFLGTGLFQFYDAKIRGIQFRLDIHEVSVNINAAIPLGLIINELISNSLKYAFPDDRTGEVAISVTKDNRAISINYSDNGIGIPAGLDWRNTESLGLRLVNTLVDQLNGTIDLDRTTGTRFVMLLQEKE
jgi:PAS domain S-box-containing protein